MTAFALRFIFRVPGGDAGGQKVKHDQDVRVPETPKVLASVFWSPRARPLIPAPFCVLGSGLCVPLAPLLYERPGICGAQRICSCVRSSRGLRTRRRRWFTGS